jgi:translation elongation factor EF-Tu-like GTPase
MRQKLFTVEDRFKIVGRGTVVTGFETVNLPELKLESPIVLVLPEGQEILAEVGGVDRFQTVSGKKGIGVLIKNITKEDIPVGTTVFLAD